MDIQKLLTVENLLKVLLAIAIGVMLYKVFFGKETYYNYHGDQSGYAYPMDYEEDNIDLTDAVSAPNNEDDMDLVSADDEEGNLEDEDYIDQIEEIQDVVDAEDDIYEYADDETEAYDDSAEMVADGTEDADAEDDDMYMYEEDLVYEAGDAGEVEKADEEQDDSMYMYEEDIAKLQNGANEIKNFDMMYSSDVEDGLQESFMLYSNLVGVDTNYS